MRKATFVHFLSLANRNPRIGAACLGFVACLIGSPLVILAISDVRFVLDGEEANARIVGPAAVVPMKFGKRYRFRFEYTDVNRQQHFGEEIRRAADIHPGDSIAIRYLSSDPSQSRAESEVRNIRPRVLAMIVLLIFVATVGTGIAGVRDVLMKVRANMAEVPSRMPD